MQLLALQMQFSEKIVSSVIITLDLPDLVSDTSYITSLQLQYSLQGLAMVGCKFWVSERPIWTV